MMAETTRPDRSSVRLELLVRNDIPSAGTPRVQTVVDRIDALCDRDDIAEVEMSHWPPCNGALERCVEHRTRREIVDELETWARDAQVTLEPAFQTVSGHSLMTEMPIHDERIVVPILTLLVYERDEIRWVSPCTIEGTVVTVDQGLQTLESNTSLSPETIVNRRTTDRPNRPTPESNDQIPDRHDQILNRRDQILDRRDVPGSQGHQ